MAALALGRIGVSGTTHVTDWVEVEFIDIKGAEKSTPTSKPLATAKIQKKLNSHTKNLSKGELQQEETKIQVLEPKDIQEGQLEGVEQLAAQSYVSELRLLIERQKVYPVMAKKLRQQGKILVKFKLQKDGTVLATNLLQMSQYKILNEAAEQLVRQISGLKPFPKEIKKMAWEFIVPIEYQM